MNGACFFSANELLPQLSMSMQSFLRAGCGALLAAYLICALPNWRRFFVSERWGGYAKSSPAVDAIQNPPVTILVACLWFAVAGMLILGWQTIAAAIINVLLCRYFFIYMRWKGVLRGMGAPGFMMHWLSCAVLLLEVTSNYAPAVRSLALLVLQVDFAFIMLSAGIYKASAGYARSGGMEYGMVNPQWGYWWRLFKNMPANHVLLRVQNHLAWGTEVVAGIFMLAPATRFIGGMLILLSFIYIATQIRLTLLCEVVMLCCVLFFHPGSLGETLICHLTGTVDSAVASTHSLPGLPAVLSVLLTAYLCLMPLAHAGLFYNFYGKRSLPAPLQTALEKFTNLFGIIIWRVFSIDLINFCIQIYVRQRDSSERILFSRYGFGGSQRYNHVAESITVTSLFTTLKYYAANKELFEERLLRYARTVPCAEDCLLEFEYVSLRKENNRFQFVPVATYTVDPAAGLIEELILDETVNVRQGHALSPIHEGAKPGSYVPVSR